MRRIWTAAGGLALVCAAAGCGTSSLHSVGPTTTLVNLTTAAGASTVAASRRGSGGSSTTPNASTTAVPPAACAELAASTLVHLTSGFQGASDYYTFTGTPVTVHCGGPDDVQYSVAASPVERLIAAPSPKVVEFTTSGGKLGPVQVDINALPAYLTTDADTRIFEVTGPLADVTGLSELYHP